MPSPRQLSRPAAVSPADCDQYPLCDMLPRERAFRVRLSTLEGGLLLSPCTMQVSPFAPDRCGANGHGERVDQGEVTCPRASYNLGLKQVASDVVAPNNRACFLASVTYPARTLVSLATCFRTLT
jgi:hypothetical protein